MVEMLRILDRQKREMLYGPTNEEQITEHLDQALNHTNIASNFITYREI